MRVKMQPWSVATQTQNFIALRGFEQLLARPSLLAAILAKLLVAVNLLLVDLFLRTGSLSLDAIAPLVQVSRVAIPLFVAVLVGCRTGVSSATPGTLKSMVEALGDCHAVAPRGGNRPTLGANLVYGQTTNAVWP
jgi:hypothetical protein